MRDAGIWNDLTDFRPEEIWDKTSNLYHCGVEEEAVQGHICIYML